MKNMGIMSNIKCKQPHCRWLLSSIIFLLLTIPSLLSAQKAVIKTNALYWATATPNLGLEVGLNTHYTLALNGGWQPWSYSNDKKLKHWMISPSARYWICDTFNGLFLSLYGQGGQFNIGKIHLPFGIFSELKTHRYQGWAAGGGLSFGYHKMLGRRWGIEFEIGVGYLYIDYKQYACSSCGSYQNKDHHNYFGPSRAAVSLVYTLK